MRLLTALVIGTLIGCISGCGGGAGSGGSSLNPVTGPNVAPIVVDAGPAGSVNGAFVSVTVCAPGTADCQTIDHVLVDTGSSGLRLVASVLSASLTLPQARDTAGDPLLECIQFADGYSWGPVRIADVQIAGEQASSLPIHTLGDVASPPVPADCPNGSPEENSVQSLGANGVLGVSVFREDCGGACANAAAPMSYYGCPASGCLAVAATLAQQVQNPAYRFGTDNNGIMIQLPTVGPAGAVSASGSLVFGIDTQSNNQLGAATVLAVNSILGTFSTAYRGQTLSNSFVDSGSTGYYFPDSSLPVCSSAAAAGFYCPTIVQTLTATNTSVTGVTSDVSFSVANAEALLLNNTFAAYENLGGTISGVTSFDWGLPFFYGRRVFIGIEGQSSAAAVGPFVAY